MRIGWLLLLVAQAAVAGPEFLGTWRAHLEVSRVGEFVHAGRAYASSSSLLARWSPPEREVAR